MAYTTLGSGATQTNVSPPKGNELTEHNGSSLAHCFLCSFLTAVSVQHSKMSPKRNSNALALYHFIQHIAGLGWKWCNRLPSQALGCIMLGFPARRGDGSSSSIRSKVATEQGTETFDYQFLIHWNARGRCQYQ